MTNPSWVPVEDLSWEGFDYLKIYLTTKYRMHWGRKETRVRKMVRNRFQ